MSRLFSVSSLVIVTLARGCSGRRTQTLNDRRHIETKTTTAASLASGLTTLANIHGFGQPRLSLDSVLLSQTMNPLSLLLLAGHTTARSLWSQQPGVSSSPYGHLESTRLSHTVMDDDFGADPVSGKLDQLQHLLQARVADPENAQVSDASIESLIQEVESTNVPFKFNESLIWGDWQLVWQLNGKKAPASQKTLASLPQYSNFMFDEKGEKVFRNIVQLSRRRFKIVADVSYDDPAFVSDNPPNRLLSTIVAANLQAQIGKRFGWKPLRIPLPLKGKGWLDIVHLSEQMRITRGNRGGLFVHLRPHLLEEAQ